MRLEIVVISGDAPIQGFGYLDGRPWYFRARGNRWWFALAAGRAWSFEMAIATSVQRGHGLLLSKKHPDTTNLSEEKVRAIIRRAARSATAFLEEEEKRDIKQEAILSGRGRASLYRVPPDHRDRGV
jgi:hypothetical protein